MAIKAIERLHTGLNRGTTIEMIKNRGLITEGEGKLARREPGQGCAFLPIKQAVKPARDI